MCMTLEIYIYSRRTLFFISWNYKPPQRVMLPFWKNEGDRMGHKHHQLLNNICKYWRASHTLFLLSLLLSFCNCVLAPQRFIKFNIHCAGRFQSFHLAVRDGTEQDGQQEQRSAVMLPHSHAGRLFAFQMLRFVVILREERVAVVLPLTFSLAPEVTLEKKAMDVQLSSGVTGLYFCKISQVISGETPP